MQEVLKAYGEKQEDLDKLSDKELVRMFKELIGKLPKKKYDYDEEWPLMNPVETVRPSEEEVQKELSRRIEYNKRPGEKYSLNKKKIRNYLRRNGTIERNQTRRKVFRTMEESETKEDGSIQTSV